MQEHLSVRFITCNGLGRCAKSALSHRMISFCRGYKVHTSLKKRTRLVRWRDEVGRDKEQRRWGVGGEKKREGLVGLVRLVDLTVSRWCAAARVRLNRRGAPRPRSLMSNEPLQGPQQHFIIILGYE